MELFGSLQDMIGPQKAGQKRDHIYLQDLKNYLQRSKPSLVPFAASIYHTIDREHSGRLRFSRFVKALFPEASERDMSMLLAMADHVEVGPCHALGHGSSWQPPATGSTGLPMRTAMPSKGIDKT